jgi:hypothetical protein
MKVQHFVCAAILVLFTSNTWGQNTPPSIGYKDKEYSGLLECEGMTDTAWTNAVQKLNGVKIEDAKKRYDGRLKDTLKSLALHIIDKVYSDSFTNAWDYAVSFYGECAQNVADVGKDRSNSAAFCMQNSMIAMTAAEYRTSGQPVENAYHYFGKLGDEKTPRSIIDRIYTGSKSRAETGLDEWQSCMKPQVAQSSTASPPPVKTILPLGGLTDQEFAAMPPCVALGEAVWGLSEEKLRGMRLEDVKKQYESQPDPQSKATLLSLADRVYADNFVSPTVYSTRYLDGCAQKKANVAPDRMGVANSCLRNAYFADVASVSKKSGTPAEKVYEPFADIYGTMASSIIDKVYRSSDPAEGGVAEWKACVISSPTWTTPQKGQEVLLASTPSGYQIGDQEKTEEIIFERLYPKGESFKNWTEQLNLAAFPALVDRTPTVFQKGIQGPSQTCVDGKVISSSFGQEDGYAFALWYEACAGSRNGKLEFRFTKIIQGHENLYTITKSFKFEPTDAQAQLWRSYLGSVKVCDSTRSGQPCPTTDVWRP